MLVMYAGFFSLPTPSLVISANQGWHGTHKKVSPGQSVRQPYLIQWLTAIQGFDNLSLTDLHFLFAPQFVRNHSLKRQFPL